MEPNTCGHRQLNQPPTDRQLNQPTTDEPQKKNLGDPYMATDSAWRAVAAMAPVAEYCCHCQRPCRQCLHCRHRHRRARRLAELSCFALSTPPPAHGTGNSCVWRSRLQSHRPPSPECEVVATAELGASAATRQVSSMTRTWIPRKALSGRTNVVGACGALSRKLPSTSFKSHSRTSSGRSRTILTATLF